jgi:menaquinone-dependent protoporphyrinogen IX oxidase
MSNQIGGRNMHIDIKIKSPDLDELVKDVDHFMQDSDNEPVTCDCFGGVMNFFEDLYDRWFG